MLDSIKPDFLLKIQYLNAGKSFVKRLDEIAGSFVYGLDISFDNKLFNLEQKEKEYSSRGYKTIDFISISEKQDEGLTTKILKAHLNKKQSKDEEKILYAKLFRDDLTDFYTELNKNLKTFQSDN